MQYKRNYSKRNYNALERTIKGFANHRRIQILDLLKFYPELSLSEISEALNINLKTASEHLRRLAIAGLILKRHSGYAVRHKLSPKAKIVLSFLRKLE